jgi:hypothetical protein
MWMLILKKSRNSFEELVLKKPAAIWQQAFLISPLIKARMNLYYFTSFDLQVEIPKIA